MNNQYESLLAGLQRDLIENERDLERASRRMRELTVERRAIFNGIHGLERVIDENEEGAD